MVNWPWDGWATLIIGLHLSGATHMALIVRKWPVQGKEPSLVNRLRRFLDNPTVKVWEWCEPIAQELLRSFAGRQIRLVIDSTKIGFNYRLLMIGLAYKRRTLPLVWSIHRCSRGHTTVKEQLKLVKRVRQWLPKRAQVWVLGDTEFQAVPLLRWLERRGWHFVMPQQGRNKVRWAAQGWTKINALSLQPGQTCFIGWVRLTKNIMPVGSGSSCIGKRVKMNPGI